ncbi:hypothetical protein WA026_007803 [Henosepilachna vigintioctopunctata]|uniref:NADP-dependent oxidoreductase domain-containing protein n=1 Tax=Henosepilachna vigintioctopunctata TaxID=420089 RepID=A0AAW1U432_9CUCU
MNIPVLTLNTGKIIPAIGYGTARVNDGELETALDFALKAGYRYIDTAYYYQNEKVIGKVLNEWITQGKLRREDLFIVTKLPPFGNYPEGVVKYLKQSLKNLQVNYVDLYLINIPFGIKDVETVPHPALTGGPVEWDLKTDHLSIWKEMEKQMNSGLTKSIGLSNFNKAQIEMVLQHCSIKPSCLQIELHAYLQQNELVDFCKKNDIIVMAYSPLGSRSVTSGNAKQGLRKTNKPLDEVLRIFNMLCLSKYLIFRVDLPDVLSNPMIQKIAKKHSKTEAQIVLRFDVQRGVIPIPKSSNEGRMKENIDIFDFELDEEDLTDLKLLDDGTRFLDFKDAEGIEDLPEYPFAN